MHGVQHLQVVAFNRQVELGGFSTQVGAQPRAFKQRQAYGRAHTPLLAVALEQLVKTNAGEPGKANQVDIRIEPDLG